MKEIIIKIPDKCGERCICFEKTETNRHTTYYICRAFDKVLHCRKDMLGNILSIERCKECRHTSDSLAEGEEEG